MEIRGSKQLYNKLLFFYMVIIVGVVSALVTYFLSSMRNRFLEQNLNYTKMMREEAIAYLENTVEIAGNIHEELYKSNTELEDLLHYFSDDDERYQQYRLNTYMKSGSNEYKGIDSFVKDVFDTYKELKRVTFFGYEQEKITEYIGKRQRSQTVDVERMKDKIEKGDLAEDGEISFLKEIRDPHTMQSIGCMIITFDGGKFETIQQYYSMAEIIVYNSNDTIVFCSENDGNMEQIIEADDPSEALDAYVEKSEVASYYITSYLNKKKAAQIPISIMLMIIGLGIALIVLGQLLVQWYLKRLMNRINQILDGMTKVMSGDLEMRIPVNRNRDELDVISLHFNEMCEKLNEYIEKQYIAEIEQKNAEMTALQSQINPHFLYNTLEAIRMKAICNGDREVGKMLYSMAVTFRSQIKEADIITMAQELYYCKKYLQLFEYRYPEQFQARIECPEEYMNVPIIKFVIQPIIENFFIHGMRRGQKDNFVRIIVSKEGEVYQMIVEDNGRGMTNEEIAAKNRELEINERKKDASIGIANVNRRIKAVYGKEYGIRIEKNMPEGLRIILRFKPDEREKQNEESHDSGR